MARSTTRTRKPTPAQRCYVLDTNVLLHDPTALFRFEEHDVILPMVVLEELDRHKKGFADTARNARQVARTFDALVDEGDFIHGFALQGLNERATGRLFIRESVSAKELRGGSSLEEGKADNQILQCAQTLIAEGRNAVLVTKDINLRVKALSCGVPAQDFRSDRVLGDEDVLPTGFLEVDSHFWEAHQPHPEAAFYRRGGRQYTQIALPLAINSFLIETTTRNRTRFWRVESSTSEGSTLYQVTPSETSTLLTPRNHQQMLAQTLLHDEDIDLVAILGLAGSGKTLLAVASGLEQVKQGRFSEVLITRATVALGEEIGFLPGNEQEKMDPWIGGTLRDVYSVLGLSDEKDPLRQKVEVASMAYMRGRSFHNKFIIIDEAQNLTQRQMRALVTRAGDGSKVVLTGNVGQIDAPAVDEATSGLTYAVKTIENWQHAGHLILPRGERSRLATWFEEAAAREHDGVPQAA
jgi:PhoH-like ATPase